MTTAVTRCVLNTGFTECNVYQTLIEKLGRLEEKVDWLNSKIDNIMYPGGTPELLPVREKAARLVECHLKYGVRSKKYKLFKKSLS